MALFIQALINASEKAAHIARTIRQEEELFNLLIEEKKDNEKNKRFYQDFKTLADVLIQETVSHDIGKQFPEIASHIKGEESNEFTNTLGEKVIIKIKDSVEETATMLTAVLDGNFAAANLLAAAVHEEVDTKLCDFLKTQTLNLPISNMGIWIDPIDSTAEYIHGKDEESNSYGIHSSGLQCVTVLIGAYDRSSGQPLVGVVNQPFYNYTHNNKLSGRIFWGICYGNVRVTSIVGSSIQNRNGLRKIVITSSSESEKLKAALKPNCELIFAAGAGYKQLCVALGLADAYILSKATTYKWDCCGPHAVLRALGGGVINYEKAMTDEQASLSKGDRVPPNYELQYHSTGNVSLRGGEQWCNVGGIITYRNVETLKEIIAMLKPETTTAL